MRIVMVAGGSGGHIYPALTLAEELKKRGHEISFIGSRDRMEKDVIPAAGFDYTGLDVLTTRGGVIQKVKSLLSIAKAYFESKKYLKNTDLVIGFGNYISLPVVLRGHHMGIRTMIHEANSFVGRANLMLDKYVDVIIGSYEENLKQFKNPNTMILGNPQSYKALVAEKDSEVLTKMGLDPLKKTVVIFMGSLGSESVNDVLLKMFEKLDGSFQTVYATGSSWYKEVREKVSDHDGLKVFERIDGVGVMKNADLLVSRAGATTLCEICAIGMPAILIPSPYVPNNHQFKNAKALCDAGAAEMIEEKDLNADLLFDRIRDLLQDDKRREEFRLNARRLSNDRVIDDIIDVVEKV